MTAEEYLSALIAKNPALGKPDDEPVTLKARGLRAIIRQAHAKGVEECAEAWARSAGAGSSKTSSKEVKDLLKMFGMKE